MSEQTITDANRSPVLADRGEPGIVAPERSHDFSNVKGIYFDLDDTLCAYWEASKSGMRKAFASLGPDGFTVEEMVLHWAAVFGTFQLTVKNEHWYPIYLRNGEPTRTEHMRLMLERMGIEDRSLAAKLSECYGVERDRDLELFEDVLEALDHLESRFQTGLMTNGPADVQRQEMASLGLADRFKHVMIEGELGFGKPKPEVFARAAKSMDLQPNQLLMVGNSYHHDVAPALRAGWHAIWIRRPSDIPISTGKVEELPAGALPPSAIVGNLRSVVDLLTHLEVNFQASVKV